VGQLVDANVAKSAGQSARTVCKRLRRYDEDENAAGHEPAVAVLKENLLQTLVVRGADLKVVRRVQVEQGHLLDLAGDLDSIAVDGVDPGSGTGFGAAGVELDGIASDGGVFRHGQQCGAGSGARVEHACLLGEKRAERECAALRAGKRKISQPDSA